MKNTNVSKSEISARQMKMDWKALISFLPEGWKEKARELGALSRNRKFMTAETLLRVLLIHIGCGYSLRVTSALSKESGLADVSDVALLKRVRACGDWFLWMAQGVMEKWRPPCNMRTFADKGYDCRLVDGTTVEEPGATGTTWKIHFSLSLERLQCTEVHVTSPKTAEGFSNFSIKKGDVLFGDRGYSTARDIFYVSQNGGYVIVRMISILPLYSLPGERFEILPELRRLETGETAEFQVLLKNGSDYLECRVCAIKKSHEAAEKAKKKIMRQASKHSFSPRESTLEFAEYVLVLTTLGDDVTCGEILEMYRMRWQVELAFKRLKSLLGLGHLKKTDQEGAKAWLHGKLFFAILIEVFIRASESFSPWGYSVMGRTEESLA
ncbi:MAG: IS4 family transposase [Synergistaceae bacterium]|jgi:hypothetical protein|nr:IS4 family transposase [Synergistaceae bacterium]